MESISVIDMFGKKKKGNEAVKQIEHGARHRRGEIFLALQQEIWQRRRIFSSAALSLQFTLMAGPAPKQANSP